MSVISSPAQLRKSQSGMVAVMVTLIMMIVISLIVLGFAQVSRRAQRNTLDAQLSTQAFYAAESGINDAITALKTKVGTLPSKNTCADTTDYQFDSLGLSQLGTDVSYSCVLIEPTPTSLSYSLGVSGGDTVIKLTSASGTPIQMLNLAWTPASGQETQPLANCPAGAAQYPAADTWTCKFGVLRSELAQTDTFTRANLAANTHVNFLEPVRAGGGGGINWATDNAKSVAAVCVDAPSPVCRAAYVFGAAGKTSYYLRIGAMYEPTKLTITAKDTLGGDVKFADVQAQISSTGKARDVLRRIMVAVSLDGNSASAPAGAIVSGDTVCKRFSVTNGSFNTEAYPGANGNPLCETAQDIGNPTNP